MIGVVYTDFVNCYMESLKMIIINSIHLIEMDRENYIAFELFMDKLYIETQNYQKLNLYFDKQFRIYKKKYDFYQSDYR